MECRFQYLLPAAIRPGAKDCRGGRRTQGREKDRMKTLSMVLVATVRNERVGEGKGPSETVGSGREHSLATLRKRRSASLSQNTTGSAFLSTK